MKILFVLLRPQYFTNYEPSLKVLAERGHRIHLTFSLGRTRGGRKRFEIEPVERLAAEFPGAFTWDGDAPERDPADGWLGIAQTTRLFGDFARYVHPRYGDSPLLRERVVRRLSRVVESRLPAPGARAAGRGFEWLLRHPRAGLSDRLVAFARDLERAIPSSGRIDAYVRDVAPDVVLVTPLVDVASNQAEYLKSATALGIPCAACISSWDNLTNKGVIRSDPDAVLVWNDAQRREAVELHGMPEERVIATGGPKFDDWFVRRPSLTRAEFAKRIGLENAGEFVLYVCSSHFIAPNEADFVKRWLTALRASSDERVRDLAVVVRPHPENAAAWRGADLSQFGSVVVYPPGGARVADDEARADFFHSLCHAVAVVGINTSALIDAAIVDTAVYTVLDDDFRGAQEGTLHFHHLLHENGGVLRVAGDLDEHVRQLADDLAEPDLHREQRRRFVQSFVRPHGLDVPTAPILADAVERIAASPARRPVTTLRSRALRRLLVPVAAAQRRTTRGPAVQDRVVGKQIELELSPLRRHRGTIVVGPWFGDIADEILYWIPFARRLAAQLGLERSRLLAVSHGGVAEWYDDFCGGYAELHELLDPATVARAFVGWAQERALVRAAAHETLGVPQDASIPVSAMRRLFAGYRRGEAPLELVLEFARFVVPARPAERSGPVVVDAAVLVDDAVVELLETVGLQSVAIVSGDAHVGVPSAVRGRVAEPLADVPVPVRRGALASTIAGGRLLVGAPAGLGLVGPSLGVTTVLVEGLFPTSSEPDVDLAAWIAREHDSHLSLVGSSQLDVLRSLLVDAVPEPANRR